MGHLPPEMSGCLAERHRATIFGLILREVLHDLPRVETADGKVIVRQSHDLTSAGNRLPGYVYGVPPFRAVKPRADLHLRLPGVDIAIPFQHGKSSGCNDDLPLFRVHRNRFPSLHAVPRRNRTAWR